MTTLGRALGFVVALAVSVGIAWASTWRQTPNDSAQAVLRLAWTARPERVEHCRSQSEEELAKIPAHMRQAVVCEGTTAAYRLEVRREGSVLLDQIVRGGGLRHDRPLYVSHDIPLPPGDAMVSVRFVRIDDSGSANGGNAADAGSDREGAAHGRQSPAIDPARRQREAEERLRLVGEIAPRALLLERRFQFSSRQVILVTYDTERRELVAVEPTSR